MVLNFLINTRFQNGFNETSLQIVLWNANGLAQDVEEVKIFIKDEKVNVMLIS